MSLSDWAALGDKEVKRQLQAMDGPIVLSVQGLEIERN